MEEKNPNLGCELAVKTRSNIRKERALGAIVGDRSFYQQIRRNSNNVLTRSVKGSVDGFCRA